MWLLEKKASEDGWTGVYKGCDGGSSADRGCSNEGEMRCAGTRAEKHQRPCTPDLARTSPAYPLVFLLPISLLPLSHSLRTIVARISLNLCILLATFSSLYRNTGRVPRQRPFGPPLRPIRSATRIPVSEFPFLSGSLMAPHQLSMGPHIVSMRSSTG